MQKLNFFDTPSPHIIIDEFLSPHLAKECLKECIELEIFYEPAKVLAHQNLADDCEECKKLGNYYSHAARENDLVYIDNLYENKRSESTLLKSLHTEITSEPFRDLMKNKGFFHILRSVTHSEAILSRYGKCDFYGWHQDQLIDVPTGRMVTIVYYLNKEPEQFEGGELIITGDTIADQKFVKPKHNRAVIFQSDSTVHAVDTVKLLGNKFEDGRFSINFWLGYEKGFRFK